jgi:hypothetical protein
MTAHEVRVCPLCGGADQHEPDCWHRSEMWLSETISATISIPS